MIRSSFVSASLRADTLSKKLNARGSPCNSSMKPMLTVPRSHLASSKPGMVLESSGGRACDMCSKEKARWYCAADKAYLCEHCDASVHSANAVAHRHDRTRMCPNGSLDPNKKKNKRAKIMNCKKKTKVTQMHRVKREKPHELMPLHAWVRSLKRRRSGRKPSMRTCISSDKLIMQEGYEHENHMTLEEEDEEEGDGVLLHPPTPAPLCRNIVVKREPSSPGVTYNLCSQITDDENPCLKAELELSDELVGLEVPTYEPFLEEVNAASNGDFIKEILPCDSLSSSVPYFMSPSCFGAQNAGRSSGSVTLLASLWTSSLISKTEVSNLLEPGYAEDIELSSVIEDGSISLKEDGSSVNGDDSDMEGLDVMKLCKIESSAPTSCMEMQDPLMMQMQVDCSGIFGGNPFIKSKGAKELENMVPCSSYPELDVLRSYDFGGHFVLVPDEQQLEAEFTSSSFSTVGFQKSLILQLDYEDVLNAWSDRGSLWMDGQRPQVVPELCFSHPGNIHTGIPTGYLDGDQYGKVPTMDEVDIVAREARVMRYKEKRRTRLFAKKIRYEVRKLNAERRPRLKGRFVKKISSQAEAWNKEDKHHLLVC